MNEHFFDLLEPPCNGTASPLWLLAGASKA